MEKSWRADAELGGQNDDPCFLWSYGRNDQLASRFSLMVKTGSRNVLRIDC